ncbi:hypothetical protein VTJ04DRAFT_1025 [Mycothermus thermophilus]|uniref:uncharacterized protein n=1 Tax=Humicola insolens TaxID=85995 RepID=UPI003743F374
MWNLDDMPGMKMGTTRTRYTIQRDICFYTLAKDDPDRSLDHVHNPSTSRPPQPSFHSYPTPTSSVHYPASLYKT